MYAFARRALFTLDPERAHDVTLGALARSTVLARRLYGDKVAHVPVDLMGLQLPNPIGLAAGLDKNGETLGEYSNACSGCAKWLSAKLL